SWWLSVLVVKRSACAVRAWSLWRAVGNPAADELDLLGAERRLPERHAAAHEQRRVHEFDEQEAVVGIARIDAQQPSRQCGFVLRRGADQGGGGLPPPPDGAARQTPPGPGQRTGAPG